MVLAEIFGMDGIIVLVVILVVLFGAPQIPKLARSLGSAKGEFERGLADGQRSAQDNPDKPGDTSGSK
jgi:sec-independent protein translocase protein TatA